VQLLSTRITLRTGPAIHPMFLLSKSRNSQPTPALQARKVLKLQQEAPRMTSHLGLEECANGPQPQAVHKRLAARFARWPEPHSDPLRAGLWICSRAEISRHLEPPCDSVSLTSHACPKEFVTACFAQLRPSSRVGAGLHHLAPL
jgi:hypothetical protein